MQGKSSARRALGSGSLIERADKAGRTSWYGKYRAANGEQRMKVLGRKRVAGGDVGLSRREAEKKLRALIDEAQNEPDAQGRHAFDDVAAALIEHKQRLGKVKPTTLQDYRILLDTHMRTYFAGREIRKVSVTDVEGYVSAKLAPPDLDRATRRAQGRLTAKTVNNHLNFLHGVFEFAIKKQWATFNPVRVIDRPGSHGDDGEVRFLTLNELEKLLQGVPDDSLGATDHALYLTAAMTGLRQGELSALRWGDIDVAARKVRVQRTFSRSTVGTPKSRRSRRSVPMVERVARELSDQAERVADRSPQGLVFAFPDSTRSDEPFYDASRMRKRFYDAMTAAGMAHRCGEAGGITFHSLRHTFGTRMASAGVPMRTLQEWMGHTDIQTTQRYAAYAPSTADDLLAEAAFSRIAAPRPK